MDKYTALKMIIPNGKFRNIQEPTIDAIIDNNKVLCLMPTGSGKSLIYQVAGICKGKTVLVISPLIALMNQQHNTLIKLGFSSVNFSGLNYKKQFNTLTNMAKNKMPMFIFSSPERISNDGYLEYVLSQKREEIGLVVIDEVHCISQWGNGFRPAYRNIPTFLNTVFGNNGWPSILCLTATLNNNEQKQIIKDFNITKTLLSKNLWRDELKLDIENLGSGKVKSKDEALGEILKTHNGEKILVFVHRKYGKKGTTRSLFKKFSGEYENAAYFDSDISDKEKERVLEGFNNGNINIVFATSAFGMGVDISDIRVVINYLISENVEQYYQEVGRAGRDGKKAYGYLLYTTQSKNGRKNLLRSSLCTEKNIRDEFECRKIKEGETFNSISYDSMTEEQRIAFSLLVDYGVIRIIAKGMQSLKCLSYNNDTGKAFLDEMNCFSKTSFTKIISKKSGKSISKISAEVWEMCAKGNLKIVSSPSKAVFYSAVSELDESILEKILQDQEKKKELRIQQFDNFVDGIEAEMSAEELIRKALDI